MCSTISVKVSAAIAWSSTRHVESDDNCDGLETVFALLLDELHLGLENSFEGRCKGVKGCAEAQKSVLHISCFQLCFWQLFPPCLPDWGDIVSQTLVVFSFT